MHRVFSALEVAAPNEPMIAENLNDGRIHGSVRTLLVVLGIEIPSDSPTVKRQLSDRSLLAEDKPSTVGMERTPFAGCIDFAKSFSKRVSEQLVACHTRNVD